MGRSSFTDGNAGRVRGIERWEIRDRAHGARQSIVTAARGCMTKMASGALPADAFAHELYASHEACREMQRFVSEYAHILGALGHEGRSATELAVQAVRDAVGQDEPPAGLIAAVREWSLEAFPSSRAQ
jgi:6-phosphofructokinase